MKALSVLTENNLIFRRLNVLRFLNQLLHHSYLLAWGYFPKISKYLNFQQEVQADFASRSYSYQLSFEFVIWSWLSTFCANVKHSSFQTNWPPERWSTAGLKWGTRERTILVLPSPEKPRSRRYGMFNRPDMRKRYNIFSRIFVQRKPLELIGKTLRIPT